MARGVQGGGCVIVHVVATGGSSPNKNPPRMTSGGNGKPFFVGYAGSRRLGRPFKAPQPVTLGLTGFGGESIRCQPMVGWKKTGTPCHERACIAVFRGLGDWSRRSRICPSPGASLHPARSSRRCVRLFAESDHPSDHVGETFGIPSTSLTIPSVLHPEGLRFPGVLLGCFTH